MKYLLVLVVVLVAVHIWRKNRREALEERQRQQPPSAPRTVPAPQAMVACRHCGTHLPRAEAVEGVLGLYCSAEHRQINEPSPR